MAIKSYKLWELAVKPFEINVFYVLLYQRFQKCIMILCVKGLIAICKAFNDQVIKCLTTCYIEYRLYFER